MAKLQLTVGTITATATATNSRANRIIRAFLRAVAGNGAVRLDRKVREWLNLPARVEDPPDPLLTLDAMSAQQIATIYVEEIASYTVARARQSESNRIDRANDAERETQLVGLGLIWE